MKNKRRKELARREPLKMDAVAPPVVTKIEAPILQRAVIGDARAEIGQEGAQIGSANVRLD